MSVQKQEFYGKEVTDAIRSACEALNVPQEMLDIEVLETGSTGIFGLIRKKARIRVSLKQDEPPVVASPSAGPTQAVVETPAVAAPALAQAEDHEDPEEVDEEPEEVPADDEDEDQDDEDEDQPGESETDASEEGLQAVREVTAQLVERMGFPSRVEVTAQGLSVSCTIRGEAEDELAGPEGKTLDAIQYLVRKMVARKTSERLRITVNIGTFRERRLEELKQRAVELARMVKESGKTQVLPALNPSERREIHMVLQEDKEVRSRSVGEGLFKKILIYKPGKSNRGGGKKKSPPRGGGRRGRKGRNDGAQDS